MIYGLDLFSGIGGLSIALSEWVRPVAYCECERYAQAVLLSRMAEGVLPKAPIWDDVRTLRIADLPVAPDIICGGFPCQDISVAGTGTGMDGERSSLFFEIARLVREGRPRFIFLENVPAITTRGGVEVVEALGSLGYDCRWGMLSASDMGAPHKRERWFFLAHANIERHKSKSRSGNSDEKKHSRISRTGETISDSNQSRLEKRQSEPGDNGSELSPTFRGDWWESEPSIRRVVDGLPYRLDRVKHLGNAVVPAQAREAFKRLMGI
jgi:DNA (cytosine-5)-methyltransferase 1